MKQTLYTTIKQAFEIKKNPLPWKKSISAGIASASPAFIGLLFDQLQNGLLAVIGSFTFLYMFNEPYVQRAKKLFFVMIGIAFSVALGTFLAPFPLSQALMVGIIGAVVTFIFGALKIPGPAAIFFVLAFTMTSAMPINPEASLERGGFVLLGGMLSWVIAMSGYFFNPRGPEINALKRLYGALADLLDAVGTPHFSEARHKAVLRIKDAEEILLAGYAPWSNSRLYKRLYLLYEQANAIFLEVLEIYAGSNTKLPQEAGQAVRAIETAIGVKKTNLPRSNSETDDLMPLYDKIHNAEAIIQGDMAEQPLQISKTSLRTVFGGSMDKNSLVFVSALRYGFILVIAALIAHSFGFDRSYWVTLSCAAVMLGSTIITTFHRAIQRTLGTIVGILLASLILSSHPDGYIIVIVILILTFLTELFIVRNYAIAAFFITPNAIFMAENTTQIYDVTFFAATRMTDVVIGCLIGLIGTILIGKRSASSRLPHLIAKTLRSQIQFIVLLFSVPPENTNIVESKEKRKMHTNLANLKVVYTTALGEIPRNKRVLEFMWPVIFSIEHLEYMLDTASRESKQKVLSDQSLAQLLLIFETMAKSVEQKQAQSAKRVPEIDGFPQIEREIHILQEAMQVGENATSMHLSKEQ